MPDLRTTPARPLLCTEPLEGRWLLSAPVAPVPVLAPAPAGPVDLPPAVAAAPYSRFPGAELLGAERGEEDGETEYDVTAALNGRTIQATLASDGEVLEIDRVAGGGSTHSRHTQAPD